MDMTSNHPYLIRALNEWILDNGMTPHLLVNAEFPGAVLPPEYAEEGKIVLNISSAAVRHLCIGSDEISFSARFGGRPFDIRIPVAAVIAIYARENGKGLVFPEEEHPENPGTADHGGTDPKKPDLRIVK